MMYFRLKNPLIARYSADNAKVLALLDPAITLTPSQLSPRDSAKPLIFASPHSGRTYPELWVKSCALKLLELRQSEDAFVDLLFSSAPARGAALLTANFPRSFIDVNRAQDELPPEWLGGKQKPTARAQAGLGVIPMAVAENMPIYARPLDQKVGLARLELYHTYHESLRQEIARAKQGSGKAVVIDCHSMPGFGTLRTRRADFILGDRYGRSCEPELVDRVGNYLKSFGYSVMRNYPYAGGYVTEHYGQPHDDVHVLQIEINRDLYLNPITMRKTAGFKSLNQHMDGLTQLLCDHYKIEQSVAAQ